MWKTIDIVPSSIRGDPQVQSACEVIDDEIEAIYGGFLPETATPSILFWPFVDEQIQPMLDIIAWEMHVDVWAGWDGALTDEQKKVLINKSIDWHQHLGTKYAVEQMLKTVFRTGYVSEWYEYGGNPYFFRVTIEEPLVDQDRLDRCIAGIMAVKNVRSWMEEIVTPSDTSRAFMYVAVIITQILENMSIPVSDNPRPVRLRGGK
jgi:phage tail P2-like protein